jgi:hypothetical protein
MDTEKPFIIVMMAHTIMLAIFGILDYYIESPSESKRQMGIVCIVFTIAMFIYLLFHFVYRGRRKDDYDSYSRTTNPVEIALFSIFGLITLLLCLLYESILTIKAYYVPEKSVKPLQQQ